MGEEEGEEEEEREGEVERKNPRGDQEGRELHSLANFYCKRSSLKPLVEEAFANSWFPWPCVLWTLYPFPGALCFRRDTQMAKEQVLGLSALLDT